MSEYVTTRRQFMQSAATLATATAVGWNHAAATFAQPAAERRIRVRRDIMSLVPDGPEIAALKAGVAAMKDRGDSDPTGWVQQSDIHRNHCTHGNFFFLPWHRAYLNHFEQICRDASEDRNFTLPYWNWTSQRTLPAVFWDETTSLFHPGRGIGPNSSAPSSAVGQSIVNTILRTGDFGTFAGTRPRPFGQRGRGSSGQLEGGPHNIVHGFVGGDMGRVNLAAMDPCFWLHHANVDRLWAEWTDRHPTGTINDSDWRNFNFANNFFDTDGNPVASATVESTLNTFDLGYRYDTQSPLLPNPVVLSDGVRAAPPISVAAVAGVEAAWGQPSSASVVPTEMLSGVLGMLARPSTADNRRKTPVIPSAQLVIEGVTPPADPNMMVRVFLNCPYLSQETSWQDPHYVGSFSFFGHDHQHDDAGHGDDTGQVYQFDITETLQQLQSDGNFDAKKPIDVQLVPDAIVGDAPVKGTIEAKSYRISVIENRVE